MKPPGQDDLHERIQRLLDGEMEQHEADALDAELRASRESRELYLQLAALHSALVNQYASRSANEPGRIISIDRLLSRQRQRMRHLATLAAAAILILAAIPLWLKLTRGPSHLATFQTTPDAIYQLNHAKELPGNINEPLLRAGSRLKLTSGRLEAQFSSGARCILKAPCELTALSGQQVQLHGGAAWFHVPPKAKGFEVRTQHLQVVDLGTEFGVLAHADGEDEIHVIKGAVEAASRHAGKEEKKIILHGGEARRIDALGNLVRTTLSTARFPSTLLKPLTIRNADFDIVPPATPDDDQRGYGPIQAWATSGAGVGLNHSAQPFLEQPAHSGSHVAFIQGNGLIAQTVSGFDPSKSYTITYFVSERGLPGAATRTSASLDLGSTSFTQPDIIRKTDAFRRIVSGPLHVFGPSANIQISAQNVLGDASLLIDSVSISRAVPAVADGGFENPVQAPKTFKQASGTGGGSFEGSAWTMSEGAGITSNHSAFSPPMAPEGSQAALLQNHGASIETTIHGFEPGESYNLSLEAAGRSDGAAPFQVLLNGEILDFEGKNSLTPPLATYQTYASRDFSPTSASQTLRIVAKGEGTSFIDDIRFSFVAKQQQGGVPDPEAGNQE